MQNLTLDVGVALLAQKRDARMTAYAATRGQEPD